MRKLARSQMRLWAKKHLTEVQGGRCLLCNDPIDLTIKGEGVIDHDHRTGRIRGILHRSCNAAEGKVLNAAGRWGAKSTDIAVVGPWLERLVKYWQQPQLELVYPTHETEEEKNDKRKARQREIRALAKAKREIAKQKKGQNGTP